jgi:hypothetical protein
MGIPKQENNIGNHFQLSSFRTNQTRQKALCAKSLASLLLSHKHQPEVVRQRRHSIIAGG